MAVTVFLVPLTFTTSGIMANEFNVPKVTLYRSLVGLICALWIVERGLIPAVGSPVPKLSPSVIAVATHLKRKAQLWQLLAAITASGVMVGLYAGIQYYGFDLFGIRPQGSGVVSSVGNSIFAGAYMLMVAPLFLALAFKSNPTSPSLARTVFWTIPLAILVLGMAFTQARGPWIGLAAGLATFLTLVWLSMGWRAPLRVFLMSAAAIAITWAVVTFNPAARADLTPRALSAGRAVISTLATEFSSLENPSASPTAERLQGDETQSDIPTSMETRRLL